VLTTAPPRLICLLEGTDRFWYIMVGGKSGSLREVRSREGGWVVGSFQGDQCSSLTHQNTAFGLRVDNLYEREGRYGVSRWCFVSLRALVRIVVKLASSYWSVYNPICIHTTNEGKRGIYICKEPCHLSIRGSRQCCKCQRRLFPGDPSRPWLV
jgi:hypothetical protein